MTDHQTLARQTEEYLNAGGKIDRLEIQRRELVRLKPGDAMRKRMAADVENAKGKRND